MEYVKLKDLCEKEERFVAPREDAYIDYVDISSVDNKSKTLTKYDTYIFAEAPSRARKKVMLGDVIVSTVRPNLNAVAIFNLQTTYTPIVSTGFCVLRNKSDVDPSYIYFFCTSSNFVRQMVSKATGASYPAVSDTIVREAKLPKHTAEQRARIVTTLLKTKKIIECRRAQLAKLDELVKCRFVELFGDPVTNPKQFPCFMLGEIVKFQGGSQPDKKHFEYESSPHNIRLLQIRDYKSDRFVTYIPKALAKRFCSADDIMIGRYGPPIFQILGGIEGAYNVALMKAVPQRGNKEFIRQFLKQDCLLKYLEGLSKRTAGQDGIQMDKLKSYPFPYPPDKLQDAFAAFVQRIDKLRFVIQKSLDETQTLFNSLMQQYFD